MDTVSGNLGVDFRVRERRLNWIEAGIGFSSQEQLRFIGEWGTRNLFDTGMRFAINSRTDLDLQGNVQTLLRNHQTDLILNKSHIFGTLWELQPALSYIHIREATVEEFQYRQNIMRAALSIRRRFGDLRNQVVTSIENRWVFNESDPRIIDPLLSIDSYQTRLLTGFVERDTRNDFFSPNRGGYQRALLQFAQVAADENSDFVKISLANSRFRDFPVDDWVLGTRFQLGYAVPTTQAPSDSIPEVVQIPTEDRFFLGGANSVRGYDQNALDGRIDFREGAPEGGLVEILFNVELRVPLVWKLGLVTFLDAGNVWQDSRQLSLERFVPHGDPNKVDPLDVRYAYGFGLRLATPVGPIRLDYARKWNQPVISPEGRDRWRVALGQAF
jgi:outer membrane protein assembly factor BamA